MTFFRTLAPLFTITAISAAALLWTPDGLAMRGVRAPAVASAFGFVTLSEDLQATSPNLAAIMADPYALMAHSPNPSWSPDGKRLALHDGWGISIFSKKGKFERKLRPEVGMPTESCRAPRWSPNGKKLVASGHFYDASFTIPVKGGEPHAVLSRGQNLWGASFSPDGARILGRSFQTGPVVVGAEGGPAVAMASREAATMEGYFPSFSPDGRYFARVLGEHGGAGDLELVRVDPQALPTGSVANPWPTLDAGGDYPAILGTRTLTLPGVVPEYAWSADGSALVAVTRSAWYDGYENYLYPDGDLVFVDLRNPRSRPLGIRGINPSLSPDGRWVAFAKAQEVGIWVAPTDGSLAPEQLYGFGTEPLWSPDGTRMLVYDVASAWAEVLVLSL